MEDVLEVYHRRYGDNEVLVCLDETSKQQVKETRTPLPPRPGVAMAYDCEYERNGVSNLFMLFAPLEGWRRVEVTDRRTKLDWARVVRQLVDVDYPDRDRIVVALALARARMEIHGRPLSLLHPRRQPCRLGQLKEADTLPVEIAPSDECPPTAT